MSAPATTPLVRPARPDDEEAVLPLLYESGAVVYVRFAGSREAALAILSAAYRRSGNTASADVVRVAEVDGGVAGAMVAFPVVDGATRARRYLRIALTRLPPWRWPRALRVFGALRPVPPQRALYVDSLATAAGYRRRGVARALLAHAIEIARGLGCTHVALETEIENAPARALYTAHGFEETDRLPPVAPDLGEGYVCLLRAVSGAPASA